MLVGLTKRPKQPRKTGLSKRKSFHNLSVQLNLFGRNQLLRVSAANNPQLSNQESSLYGTLLQRKLLLPRMGTKFDAGSEA